MAKTAWIRSLGTSKREQGIITPKAPQNQPRQRFFFSRMPKNRSLFDIVFDFFKHEKAEALEQNTVSRKPLQPKLTKVVKPRIRRTQQRG